MIKISIVGLRYIKETLEHKSIETTEIYLNQIILPLDDLNWEPNKGGAG